MERNASLSHKTQHYSKRIQESVMATTTNSNNLNVHEPDKT